MLIFEYYLLWIKISAYLLLPFCYGCLIFESFKLTAQSKEQNPIQLFTLPG